MIFIVLPATITLVLLALFTRKKIFGWLLLVIWAGILGIVVLSAVTRPFFEKKKLQPEDYYGTYAIDRNMYPGFQADWQYNHFRFVITEDDSIFLHVTDHEKILQTFKGTVSFSTGYSSSRGYKNESTNTPRLLYKSNYVQRDMGILPCI